MKKQVIIENKTTEDVLDQNISQLTLLCPSVPECTNQRHSVASQRDENKTFIVCLQAKFERWNLNNDRNVHVSVCVCVCVCVCDRLSETLTQHYRLKITKTHL